MIVKHIRLAQRGLISKLNSQEINSDSRIKILIKGFVALPARYDFGNS